MSKQNQSRLSLSLGLVFFISLLLLSMEVRSFEPGVIEGYTGYDAAKVGSATCTMCHSDQVPESLLTHVSLIDNNPGNEEYGYGCEGCHGPGGNHNGDPAGILNPSKLSSEIITDICSRCHSDLNSFNTDEWVVSEHYFADVSCTDCHSGHTDNQWFLVNSDRLELCYTCHAEKRSEFSMRSHHPVNEGQVGCDSCHNVHSGTYEGQLIKDGDELCFTCHIDKQGPFAYDHPVSMAAGGDGCQTCHFAHGSNSDDLLRLPQRLCLQCHTDRGPSTHFAGTCWSAGCHVEIHGSNTDPLFFN
ncbi:MAG: cytochrome c3 family protein [bacterium]|nr:cytochrome c3 family protein [bacterium]